MYFDMKNTLKNNHNHTPIEIYRKDNSLLTMHPIFIGLKKCSICRTIQRKIR